MQCGIFVYYCIILQNLPTGNVTFEHSQKIVERSAKSRWEWYFVTKIVLVIEKTSEIRPRICKKFEIIRTINSNSESSEQFLVTDCFFQLVPGGFSYLIDKKN